MTRGPTRHLHRLLGRIGLMWRLTMAQLRHEKLRLGLAIMGTTLAVLSITLLAGTGMGVMETGEQQFEAADRDLWVSAGEMRLSTGGGGGFENTLYDSRTVSAEMETHEGVNNAIPLAFDTVYVAAEPDGDFQTYLATGVPGSGSSVQVTNGTGLQGDPHYAEGTYEGNRTQEVLIDQGTARTLDVSVNDTMYVGGSLAAARANEVTVVGISPTFEQMLGAPTVTMPLSELHQTTGQTRSEPATFITVSVREEADIDVVQQDLQEAYPEYEIQQPDEQLESVLQEQVLVIAAGLTLVVLAIAAGAALTYTLLSLVVFQQREVYGALDAQGISSIVLVGSLIGQGLLIGIISGVFGIALTIPAVEVLNRIATAIVGFDGLVQTSDRIFLAGFVIAVGVATVAATVAGWRVGRSDPLENIR